MTLGFDDPANLRINRITISAPPSLRETLVGVGRFAGVEALLNSHGDNLRRELDRVAQSVSIVGGAGDQPQEKE